MKMNRRNVLLGLGTIVAGGGAALGTGAFSQVEAERTVSVETAGDDDGAFLQIEPNDDYDGEEGDYVDVENSQFSIDIGEDNVDGVNENARTTFTDLFTVSNTGTQNVGFYVEEDDDVGDILDFEYDSDSIVTGDSGSSADDTAVDLDENGDSVDITLVVDLIDNNDSDLPEQVTFVADVEAYND